MFLIPSTDTKLHRAAFRFSKMSIKKCNRCTSPPMSTRAARERCHKYLCPKEWKKKGRKSRSWMKKVYEKEWLHRHVFIYIFFSSPGCLTFVAYPIYTPPPPQVWVESMINDWERAVFLFFPGIEGNGRIVFLCIGKTLIQKSRVGL